MEAQVKKISVPNSWNEVTLSQYQRIANLNFKELSAADANVKILSILTGVPEDIIEDMAPAKLIEAIRAIQFIYNNEQSKGAPVSLELNGQRYSVKTNINSGTAGEHARLKKLVHNYSPTYLPEIISYFIFPIDYWGRMLPGSYTKANRGLFRTSKIITSEYREKMISDIQSLDMATVLRISKYYTLLSESLVKTAATFAVRSAKEAIKESEDKTLQMLNTLNK